MDRVGHDAPVSRNSHARHGAFWGDRRAATAVEFALVAPLFLSTLVFLMMIGYISFLKQGLDFAAQRAARQIRIGAVQTAGLTQTQFRTNVVCPLLPFTVSCNDVIVNVQNVSYTAGSSTNYQSYNAFVNANQTNLSLPTLSNASTSYCPGQGGQLPDGTATTPSYVYLQIVYPSVLSMAAYTTGLVTYNGQKATAIMATATFLNEPFTAPASAC